MKHMAQPTSMFLPHGAPDLPISKIAASKFLRQVAKKIRKPKGIVIVSAHWETSGIKLTTAPHLGTMYDFSGFSPELYRLKYAAKTTEKLIDATGRALAENGLSYQKDTRRGLDHGAWIPLMLAYPKADVPIVQLSLDRSMTPAALFELGQGLSVLKNQGILIIGSGATVHNLRAIQPEGTAAPHWATKFDAWVDRQILDQNWVGLQGVNRAPNVKKAHPTIEHFLPLIVAAGAGAGVDQTGVGQKLHSSFSYGSVGMSAWAFDQP